MDRAKVRANDIHFLHPTGIPFQPKDFHLQVTCDALFLLFGLYGNVVRVKIMKKSQDRAFVQFEHPEEAYGWEGRGCIKVEEQQGCSKVATKLQQGKVAAQ